MSCSDPSPSPLMSIILLNHGYFPISTTEVTIQSRKCRFFPRASCCGLEPHLVCSGGKRGNRMGKMFMCVREGRRQTLGPYARPASVDRTGGGSHSPPSRFQILFVFSLPRYASSHATKDRYLGVILALKNRSAIFLHFSAISWRGGQSAAG